MNKRSQKQPVPQRFHLAPLATFDLRNAIALHQRGQLVEAERIYLNILKTNPYDFDAQHLLGLLKHHQGRHTEALKLIGAALKKKPDEAAALANYGVSSAMHSRASTRRYRAATRRSPSNQTLRERSTIAATPFMGSSASTRHWRATIKRLRSSQTMQTRSTIEATPFMSSSASTRRWQAMTRPSCSSQ